MHNLRSADVITSFLTYCYISTFIPIIIEMNGDCGNADVHATDTEREKTSAQLSAVIIATFFELRNNWNYDG